MSATRRPGRRLRAVRDLVWRLTDAVDAFLAQSDLAVSSCRSYTQTLGRLRDALGEDRPLGRVGARELEHATLEAWGATAPATWNRHVAPCDRSMASAVVAAGCKSDRRRPRALPRAGRPSAHRTSSGCLDRRRERATIACPVKRAAKDQPVPTVVRCRERQQDVAPNVRALSMSIRNGASWSGRGEGALTDKEERMACRYAGIDWAGEKHDVLVPTRRAAGARGDVRA